MRMLRTFKCVCYALSNAYVTHFQMRMLRTFKCVCYALSNAYVTHFQMCILRTFKCVYKNGQFLAGLRANGSSCFCYRLVGLYGPMEQRHLPRSIETIKKGYLKVGMQQGCQMVSFRTKNPNLGKFWRALDGKILIYFRTFWNILWAFGLIYYHLVLFVFIWYIFPVLLPCTKKNLATLVCRQILILV
jgi:hypothetical protein